MIPDFKVTITERGWEASARVLGWKSGDLEIILEGNTIRVVGKKSDSTDSFESLLDVPAGFDKSQARATYLNGALRIIIPKLPGRMNLKGGQG